jgi:hypothetical protein
LPSPETLLFPALAQSFPDGGTLDPAATRPRRPLTAAEFHRLADVPPEVRWFANLSNPGTRRAYENAIGDFHALYRHRPRRFTK